MSALNTTIQVLQSGFLFPVAIILVVVLSSYAHHWYFLLKYNLPPGPVGWPFLGYLPLLNKETGYIAAINLSKKYGNIVSLYVGRKLVVILDDFNSIKAAYNREEFLSRPDKIPEVEDGQPAVTDSNGCLWREQRRFMATSLRQLGTGNKSFESTVMERILEVCSTITTLGGQNVNLNQAIQLATHNISFHLLYGKKFEASHPMIRLLSEYHRAVEVHTQQNILKLFMPPVAYLMEYTSKLKNTRKIQKRMDNIIREEILEHRKTLNISEPRDIIDYFLLNMKKPESADVYNMSTLFGNVKSMLFASSDTIKQSLVWFFLLVAKYQDVQKKIHNEIDRHIGRDREPQNSDRGRLPYTEATVLESMRLYNIGHWNIMRMTAQDTTLCGFEIPKDTVIMHNMSSQFHNPLYYDSPQDFDPTRFLSQDGRSVHVPEHFIPFSYGKRNCLGEKLASLTLFLFCTTTLQRFDVLPPTDGVNLDKKTEFLNVAAKPFAVFNVRA